MRIRSLSALLLIAALLLSLAGCGKKEQTPSASGGEQAVPTLAPAPESSEAPAALPAPKGAASAQELVDLCVEYINTGDRSHLAEYQDQAAYLAYFLMEDVLDERELSWDEALKTARLILSGAEALQAQDPEAAAALMEEFDAMEPEEFVKERIDEIKDDIRRGDLTEENYNYEKYVEILTDADKGVDYVIEHHPELLDEARWMSIPLGLEDTIDQLKSNYLDFDYEKEDLVRFRGAELQYRPERVQTEDYGVSELDLGSVIDDGSSWSLGMLYYVEDARYYFMGFTFAVGGIGG